MIAIASTKQALDALKWDAVVAMLDKANGPKQKRTKAGRSTMWSGESVVTADRTGHGEDSTGTSRRLFCRSACSRDQRQVRPTMNQNQKSKPKTNGSNGKLLLQLDGDGLRGSVRNDSPSVHTLASFKHPCAFPFTILPQQSVFSRSRCVSRLFVVAQNLTGSAIQSFCAR